MSSFFHQLFWMRPYGFRRGFNPQHRLIAMLEKWRSRNYKGISFGVLQTYSSKAFDCLSYKFLITKQRAYGFMVSIFVEINVQLPLLP